MTYKKLLSITIGVLICVIFLPNVYSLNDTYLNDPQHVSKSDNYLNSNANPAAASVPSQDISENSLSPGDTNGLSNNDYSSSISDLNQVNNPIPQDYINYVNTYDIFNYNQRLIFLNSTSFLDITNSIHTGDYFKDYSSSISQTGDAFLFLQKNLVLYNFIDNDHDGFPLYKIDSITGEKIMVDYNDNNPYSYPGAREMCDGIDNNYNGIVDEKACQCNDGLDNDYNGLADINDPSCWNDPNKPNTYNPFKNIESGAIVKCRTDADCGGNAMSPDFCMNNDLYFRTRLAKCTNPGLESSKCEVRYSLLLKQKCNLGCNNNYNNASCLSQEDIMNTYNNPNFNPLNGESMNINYKEVPLDYSNNNYLPQVTSYSISPDFFSLKIKIFLSLLMVGIILEMILFYFYKSYKINKKKF